MSLTKQVLHLTNPVHPGYFADPFVFRHGGIYYAVGTGEAKCHANGKVCEFPMLRSDDFVTWRPLGGALEHPEIEGDAFWAPEIAFSNGTFYMYYSVGYADKGHHLRVATSSQPEGPYRDTGTPLLDPANTPFAIDPHPFQDDDGTWYLYYARDFLDAEDGARPGTALAVAPLLNMVRLPEDFKLVMRAHHDWQRFQSDRPIYRGIYDWHTLEGPCMLKHEGRYFCLYSGGNWHSDAYGLDFAVGDNPLGPFEDTNEGHARVLSAVADKVLGPGHNSVVVGPDGRTQYVAYHAWDTAMQARRLCFDKLVWTPTGPQCLGPTWEPQVIAT